MSYQEFVDDFRLRVTAILTRIRAQLIANGVPEYRITPVDQFEQDTNDLRFQLRAFHGAGEDVKGITIFIELTDGIRVGLPGGRARITLFAQAERFLTSDYDPGDFQPYAESGGVEDEIGLDELRAKLGELEEAIPNLVNKAQSYFNI